MDLVGGYRFLPIGPTHLGAIVKLADEPDLSNVPGTHLCFPVESLIDAMENTNFGIIQVTGQDSSCMVYDDEGTPCYQIQPGLFEGSYWAQHRQDINSYLQQFGVTVPVTADSMYQQLVNDLIQYLGASQADIDAGLWWVTTPLTTVGPQATFFLLDGGGNQAGRPVQPNNQTPIIINFTTPQPPTHVKQYEKLEAEIVLDPNYFHHIGDPAHNMDQGARFDAYDADHDGERIIVDARFRLMSSGQPDATVVQVDGKDQVFNVPCFCMKETSDGAFKWKVRFAPPQKTAGTQVWELTARAAVWHKNKGDTADNYDEFKQVNIPNGNGQTYYHYFGYNNDTDPPAFAGVGNHHSQNFAADKLPIPTNRLNCDAGVKDGPLQINSAGGFYLQQLKQANGYAPQPIFLAGQTMPYLPANGNTAIDPVDMASKMAGAGMNFCYNWLSAGELVLPRPEQTEDWYTGQPDPNNPCGPTNQPVPVPDADKWRAYSYYDQGRADRLDKIVEADITNNIYQGIVIWPHTCLSENFQGSVGLSQPANGDFNTFFSSASDDTKSAWLWQKNFYRYLVARYGYSRTLSLWIVVAELEGVGPNPYSGNYWWNSGAVTHGWHDKVVKTLRDLDYRQRPVTSTTTQFNESQGNPYFGATEKPGHGDFQGYAQKVDIVGFDSYPTVWVQDAGGPDGIPVNREDPGFVDYCRTTLANAQQRMWHYGVGRMYNWTKNTGGMTQPHLIAEFGMVERANAVPPPFPANDPILESQIRSYVHFCLWAAFANGHAGTPLKWFDGGQFGSLFPYGGVNGNFAPPYPNFSNEYAALIALLAPGGPLADFGNLTDRITGMSMEPNPNTSTVRAFGLQSGNKRLVAVWMFDDDTNNTAGRSYTISKEAARNDQTLVIPNLILNARYSVSRYNTWDGGVLVDGGSPQADANGTLRVAVGTFPISQTRANVVWDGADVMMILRTP